MLEKQIKGFLQYCKVCGFRARSLQTLTIRLNDFNRFLRDKRLSRVRSINYSHLSAFVADFKSPSIHVKKSRIWSLRQFYHYLKLNGIVRENIALALPYPKIEKTVPKFLTIQEYNRILHHFTDRVKTPFGLRNLIIILLLGLIGIRTGAIIALNVQDIDLVSGLAWIKEKGLRKRIVVLPETISILLYKYLEQMGRSRGPLFLSKRGKRISPRTLESEWGQSLISDYDFICYIISRGYIDSANYILIILITNQALTPIRMPEASLAQSPTSPSAGQNQ